MDDSSDSERPATDTARGRERRSSVRRRQYRGGQLVFNQMFSAMDCLVRDISEGGARIECESTQAIPQHLILKLGDRETFDCEVVWKSRTNIGVRFAENARLNDFLHQLTTVHRHIRFPITELLAQADGFKTGSFGRVNRPGFEDYLNRMIAASQSFLAAIETMEREFGTGEHHVATDQTSNAPPVASQPPEPPAPDNDNSAA